MEDYTERYSKIRVTEASMRMADVREEVGSLCVFNVDNVRYQELKNREVVVIGVVVDISSLDASGTSVVTLWNFGPRRCSLLLEKQAIAHVQPLLKGTVLMITKPSLTFREEKMYLAWQPEGKLLVLGRSKDYGVCGHKDKNGTTCYAAIDRRCGPLCATHSESEIGRLKKAQAMRPELKGSWAALTHTYGHLEKRGGRKRKATFIGSPTDGAPMPKNTKWEEEEEKIIELAEKAVTRGSKLALLGCVENMRGLRRGSLKEKQALKKSDRANLLPGIPTRRVPQNPGKKEVTKQAQCEVLPKDKSPDCEWNIDVGGYNSDENSHSYWLAVSGKSPLGISDTPCSKPPLSNKTHLTPRIATIPEDEGPSGVEKLDSPSNRQKEGAGSGTKAGSSSTGCGTKYKMFLCPSPTKEELIQARKELLL